MLAPLTLYVAGIPTFFDTNVVAKLLRAVSRYHEFHVPTNDRGANRHFGFVIFDDLDEMKKLEKLGKISLSGLKLTIKRFNPESYFLKKNNC